MNKTFQSVGMVRPGRSVFDLSYTHLLTGDMGYLYPVMCREVVPGDVFDVGVDLVIRFMPLTAPMLHEVNAFIHYFYVPYRILWDDWESFITGGSDGTEAPTLPTQDITSGVKGKLVDFLGFELGKDYDGFDPVSFPWYAYNTIYNEYYRDQTSIAEVALTNGTILKRAWERDYFTSALPWQQRGTAPALPLSGNLEVTGTSGNINIVSTAGGGVRQFVNDANNPSDIFLSGTGPGSGTIQWASAANWVDAADAATFDVADLRLAFQLQKFLERNARAGARYTEFLRAHYGVAPRDDRLDRPEYFGGVRMPIIISEVLQTSETNTTPQGTLAGHGITAGSSRVGKYRVTEFGLIMGILSVMPKPMYQQGMDRQWYKQTRYDFYFPEFAFLSEQPIYNAELFVTAGDGATNAGVFGYQERFAEMRSSRNIVSNGMRDDFDHWHMSRQFSALPTLGQTFLECTPRDDPAFAVPGEDQMVIHVGNRIRAVRPLPVHSSPGYIDH